MVSTVLGISGTVCAIGMAFYIANFSDRAVIVAGNTSLCTCTNESDRHATTYGFYERSPLRSLNARIYHACVRQFERRRASRAKIPQLETRDIPRGPTLLLLPSLRRFDVNDPVTIIDSTARKTAVSLRKRKKKRWLQIIRTRFANIILDETLSTTQLPFSSADISCLLLLSPRFIVYRLISYVRRAFLTRRFAKKKPRVTYRYTFKRQTRSGRGGSCLITVSGTISLIPFPPRDSRSRRALGLTAIPSAIL